MTWHLRHPSAIPRPEWLARLETIPNASPYLLPEWSQFWADVWPGTEAEVYDDGKTLIPSVRRSRYGLNWRFAQPYGTDCIIGDGSLDWDSLLAGMSRNRAVEVAISADVPTKLRGWTRTALMQNRWIISVAGRTYADLSQGFSGSHIRNIAKGEDLQLRIGGTEEIESFIRLWQDAHRAPRYMLNIAHAKSLIRHFAPIGSLHLRTAWAGERPVAGKVFLVHKNVAVSLDSCVDRDPQFRGAGHFLVAHCLASLINSGITHIDLGGVPGGSDHAGLDEFKSGWNATQDTIHTTLYRRNWYAKLRNRLS
jgi:hypothetical protein